MNTNEAYELFCTIKAVREFNIQLPIKLNYALGLNYNRLLPIAQAFEMARQPLLESRTKKDASGTPLTKPNGQPIFDDEAALALELKPLLDEPCEVTPHMVDLETFPESFPSGLFGGLMAMIRMGDDEAPKTPEPSASKTQRKRAH